MFCWVTLGTLFWLISVMEFNSGRTIVVSSGPVVLLNLCGKMEGNGAVAFVIGIITSVILTFLDREIPGTS